VPIREQYLAQMRAYKPGPAGDYDAQKVPPVEKSEVRNQKSAISGSLISDF
jgi:hypothetical protein